jgi:arylsulfatase/arylsulfatase A
MTDDQGYGDLGITGNPIISTPNIDTMARQSAWMTNFYVSPVCAPTRACLMTGRYNYRTRCVDTYIGRAMMDPAEVTIAEILRDAGYATGIFGKWHLGDCYPMRAIDQGFEQALVHRGGGIGQPSDPPGSEAKYTDAILQGNGKPEQTKGYCTDVYYDNGLKFIEEAHRRQRPFFVYLPDNCPHAPFGDVPEQEYEKYSKLDLRNQRFPQDQGHALPKEDKAVDKRARVYSMISNVDRNVGRLFKTLENLKIVDNTLVIFMVDNGPNGRRYVSGMRGKKADVREGGIHSPFFAHWPARLVAGHRSDRVAAHIDVLPTLLEACDVNPPTGVALDGRSFLPLLTGEQIEWQDRTLFIQSHRGDEPVRYHNFAARSQQWKLLHASGFGHETFTGPPIFELYNMQTDPLEMKNVAVAQPRIVEKLRAQYEEWFDDVSSTRPDNYAPPRIHVGTPHESPTVLTRQDWRHTEGRHWARNSIGHWLLHIEEGTYNVDCRFPPEKHAGKAELRVNDIRLVIDVEAEAQTCTFRRVQLPGGDAHLQVVLAHGEQRRGVHQVDVALH